MKPLLLCCLATFLFLAPACRQKNTEEQAASLQHFPEDVISVTKPLISGQLYDEASFEGATLTSFDKTQELQILDTSDVIFTKVRVRKDDKEYTGFIPKAILPE